MPALIIVLLIELMVQISLKILPKLIGFTFSIFVLIPQIALEIILIPVFGAFLFAGCDIL